jgi:bifunctional DNA primase/polymerase-like protein
MAGIIESKKPAGGNRRAREGVVEAATLDCPKNTPNVHSLQPFDTDSRGTMIEAALRYAAAGWAVLPLASIRTGGGCGCWRELQCSHPGKHPNARLARHGVKDASADPEVVRRWFRTAPNSNIALATGRISGFWVLDIDPRHDGIHSLEAWERKNGRLPLTAIVHSGGGGRHLYWSMPPSREIRNRVGILPGVDVRSDGGSIVAPPSRHSSGLFYVWELPMYPFAQAPDSLLDLVSPRQPIERTPPRILPGEAIQGRQAAESPYVRAVVVRVLATLAAARPGSRNQELFKAAAALAAWFQIHAIDEAWARFKLKVIAKAIGLGTLEIATTIESGFRAGRNSPRCIPPQRGNRHPGSAGVQ